MDMVDRIRALCAAHGTNLFQLEKTLGFANGSLAKSDEKIQSWRLKAIADYFHVTVDYLISGETPEYYTNPETASLAQELFGLQSDPNITADRSRCGRKNHQGDCRP